jgi:hypothetical protein
MCYLLLVGSAGQGLECDAWQALEDRLALPLEKGVPSSSSRAAFPMDDWVWLVTHRGCSCDLVAGAGQPSDTVQLSREARSALIHLARRTGVVRFYLRSREPAQRGHRASTVRLIMTVPEMLEPHTKVPTNCLVELVEAVPSSHLS